MRKIISINDNWQFSKDNANFENVNIPHTWNNYDGQDGGADYLRQKCYYKKNLILEKTDEKIFLEFEGVNHLANVFLNGKELGEHRGGFSTFRFDITDVAKEGDNELIVTADNSDGLQIYPQSADFTFFGGIHRNASVIYVSNTHFCLDFYGSHGVYITPKVNAQNADVCIETYIAGDVSNAELNIEIKNANGEVISQKSEKASPNQKINIGVANPILWNGIKNPYLYTLSAAIKIDDITVDNIDIPFGIRSFSVDANRGFILNGEECSLRGVSRHQDKMDKGWALSYADHDLDMQIIKEMGANTIRLAHYQHNQYFYDLCDQNGMAIWAEIPFITQFMSSKEAQDNTKSQMTELVLQNYNHPSVFFWGISNEITIAGESDELLENQKQLVEIIHKYDTSRLTTLANVSFVEMDSSQNIITDIVSFNHYFGWYGGKLTDNEEWIDAFHAKYPNIPLGISEYGAEGIMTLHNDNPQMRDYSEEYHAVYHEHMLEVFEKRPFLWSTHQWNMFDFAADARDEGGVKGRNNKGLVSYDRKIKKDAYFLYKAYWNSKDEFVHITGRRYEKRHNLTTNIKVYSNAKEVCLLVNGEEYAPVKGEKIFIFENVKLNLGENKLLAKTANSSDEITLTGVDKAIESYILPEEPVGEGAENWFNNIMSEGSGEMTFNADCFSIKDKMGDLLENEETKAVLMGLFEMSGQKTVNPGMLKMISGMKMEVVLKMAGAKAPEGFDKAINAKLQKIKK